jgi:hypothetical protein
MVDVGDAILALGQGASSLIRQAYLRKQAQAELARQQMLDQQQREQIAYQRQQHEAETAYQHQRDTVTDRQHEREYADKQEQSARDFGLKKEDARIKALQAGITPGTSEIQYTPQPTGDFFKPPSDAELGGTLIGRTMRQPTPPKPGVQITQTPESYDPMHAAKAIQGLADIQARADYQARNQRTLQDQKQEDAIELKKLGGQIAINSAKERAKYSTKGGGRIAGSMTAGQRPDCEREWRPLSSARLSQFARRRGVSEVRRYRAAPLRRDGAMVRGAGEGHPQADDRSVRDADRHRSEAHQGSRRRGARPTTHTTVTFRDDLTLCDPHSKRPRRRRRRGWPPCCSGAYGTSGARTGAGRARSPTGISRPDKDRAEGTFSEGVQLHSRRIRGRG